MANKRLLIQGVNILGYGKNGAAGHCHFSAPALQQVGTKFTSIHEAIGCSEEFEDYIPKCDLDGDLLIQSFELVPQEKDLRDYGLIGTNEITGCRLHKFKATRLEIKGSQGAGKRYEYRFDLSFSDPLGLTKLERLYNGAPERPIDLSASFTKQAVQQTLPGTDGVIDGEELRATPEQTQRVLGLEEDDAAPPVIPPDELPSAAKGRAGRQRAAVTPIVESVPEDSDADGKAEDISGE